MVHVVATGGTIANTTGGRVGIKQVIGAVPEAQRLARFAVTQTSRAGSEHFTPHDWLAIGRAVAAAAAEASTAGVLVTHGSFTNEETAYFLHLTVRTSKPIVVVSSQRRHGTSGNDGDRNLLDAIRVATSPEAVGQGVLTVLNEDIHSARDVIKTSSRPDGFRSRDPGVLGHVDSDQVTFYRRSLRRHTSGSEFDIGDIEELPRVDIVYAYAGADELSVSPLLERAKPAGLIVAGMAFAGIPAPGQLSVLDQVSDVTPIVLTSRGMEGRVPHPAEESGTSARGYLTGDNLSPHKARILLMVALTRLKEKSDLQRIFDEC